MTRVQVGITQSFNIDFSKLPTDDPLAYAFGFVEGINGIKRSKPEDRHGLAPAYVAGHAHGKRIVNEGEALPAWATKAESIFKQEGPKHGS